MNQAQCTFYDSDATVWHISALRQPGVSRQGCKVTAPQRNKSNGKSWQKKNNNNIPPLQKIPNKNNNKKSKKKKYLGVKKSSSADEAYNLKILRERLSFVLCCGQQTLMVSGLFTNDWLGGYTVRESCNGDPVG